jgi:hypothetical protein
VSRRRDDGRPDGVDVWRAVAPRGVRRAWLVWLAVMVIWLAAAFLVGWWAVGWSARHPEAALAVLLTAVGAGWLVGDRVVAWVRDAWRES